MRLLTHNFLQSNVRGWVKGGWQNNGGVDWSLDRRPNLLFGCSNGIGLTSLYHCNSLSSTCTISNNNFNRTKNGYPLIIDKGAELLIEESPVDANLVLKMLTKLDYNALVTTTNLLRQQHSDIPELPEKLPEDKSTLDDKMIAQYHKVLFDVHLIQGHLVCPDTGRKFPVKDGIPNMILHEDEIWKISRSFPTSVLWHPLLLLEHRG